MHRGQSRAVDYAPFILLPIEVAALLSVRGCDEHVVAAGLLHDEVENTGARVEDIRERFGDCVAGIVAAVSEDPTIGDYATCKAALREQVARSGPDAHVALASIDAIYAIDVASPVEVQEFWEKYGELPGFAAGT